jgi:hypothetical protein
LNECSAEEVYSSVNTPGDLQSTIIWLCWALILDGSRTRICQLQCQHVGGMTKGGTAELIRKNQQRWEELAALGVRTRAIQAAGNAGQASLAHGPGSCEVANHCTMSPSGNRWWSEEIGFRSVQHRIAPGEDAGRSWTFLTSTSSDRGDLG